MSQNPYAAPRDFGEVQPPAAKRTSVTAVASLICSLVCCIPGTGVIGVILGLAALFLISASQGRVGGRGVAIVGIALGTLLTGAWGGGAWFAATAVRNGLIHTGAALKAIDAGDYAAARIEMGGGLAVGISDAEFEAFRQAYQGEMGSFQSMPTGVREWWSGVVGKGPSMQAGQPQPSTMPAAAEFDNGTALIFLVLDQTGGTSTPWYFPPVSNIMIRTPGGNEVWLTGPNAPPQPPASPAPPAPPGGNGG